MEKIKSVGYVLLGAASYGVLATFVKLANETGLAVGALTLFQFLIGLAVILILAQFSKKTKQKTASDKKDKVKLTVYGASLGFTSCFYYLSIQYVPVSIGIILLMQAIWMSVVLEIILQKSIGLLKVIGGLSVIVGTLLAVNIFDVSAEISFTGVVYGVLAALSYTATLYASNKVALGLPNIIRSLYLVLGGLIVVLLFWNVKIIEQVNWASIDLWMYGLFLALFGTIIPPIAFNKGFPVTGIGLGSILASVEIPVSILTAKFLLNEQILPVQWAGVGVIILAIVLINYKQFKKE